MTADSDVPSFNFLSYNDTKFVSEKAADDPDIYCLDPEAKTIFKIFLRVILQISTNAADWTYISAHNPGAIMQEFSDLGFFSPPNLWRSDKLSLNPFNASCVGIITREKYSLVLHRNHVDIWYLAYLIMGLLLFFSAKSLSRNVLFYYSTGVSVGVLGAILVVLFFVSRLVPKRTWLGWFLLFTGWSAGVYLVQWVSDNVYRFIDHYPHLVIGYVTVVGVISFGICYRYGPPKDVRSLNLIQWSIQLLGILLVYNGVAITEFAVAVILAILLFYSASEYTNTSNFCRTVQSKLWKFSLFSSRRPTVATPKKSAAFLTRRRFLTEEEYHEEGVRETSRALKELRDHLSSPGVNPWPVVAQLKNPRSFANFMISGDESALQESENTETENSSVEFSSDTSEEEQIADDLHRNNNAAFGRTLSKRRTYSGHKILPAGDIKLNESGIPHITRRRTLGYYQADRFSDDDSTFNQHSRQLSNRSFNLNDRHLLSERSLLRRGRQFHSGTPDEANACAAAARYSGTSASVTCTCTGSENDDGGEDVGRFSNASIPSTSANPYHSSLRRSPRRATGPTGYTGRDDRTPRQTSHHQRRSKRF